jgi:hypothetical protein
MSKLPKGRRNSTANQKSVTAREILKEMSISYPVMYEGCMKDVIQGIMNDNDSASGKHTILQH